MISFLRLLNALLAPCGLVVKRLEAEQQDRLYTRIVETRSFQRLLKVRELEHEVHRLKGYVRDLHEESLGGVRNSEAKRAPASGIAAGQGERSGT